MLLTWSCDPYPCRGHIRWWTTPVVKDGDQRPMGPKAPELQGFPGWNCFAKSARNKKLSGGSQSARISRSRVIEHKQNREASFIEWSNITIEWGLGHVGSILVAISMPLFLFTSCPENSRWGNNCLQKRVGWNQADWFNGWRTFFSYLFILSFHIFSLTHRYVGNPTFSASLRPLHFNWIPTGLTSLSHGHGEEIRRWHRWSRANMRRLCDAAAGTGWGAHRWKQNGHKVLW